MKGRLRIINGVLAVAVLVMFVIHGIFGALNMMDIAPIIVKMLSHTMLVLIGVHALISIVLTVQAVRAAAKTHAPYLRRNYSFWARRLSGALILILVFFHMTAFGRVEGGVFKLYPFDINRLIVQLLFLLGIAVHIITNVKPALITFGIKKLKPKSGGMLFFISVALLFMAAGFIIYFIRWQL